MTLGHFIQSTSAMSFPGDFKRLEIELLLSHILCCERMHLYTRWGQELSKNHISQFQSLFRLRKKGMPMAYILGKKEFYTHKFIISPGVFIPRAETETLVSAVSSQWSRSANLKIVDFGCGSGCIGLSLLTSFPKSNLISIDINKKALNISKRNAKKIGVKNRVTFLYKDISTIDREWKQKYIASGADIIVANPPYIAFNDPRVEKEVVSFEPSEALFSDDGGLYHIRSWLRKALLLLKINGSYFFEIGAEQDISFLKSGRNKMIKKSEFRDLSGIVRVIQLQKI